jgi:hypothetical protein
MPVPVSARLAEPSSHSQMEPSQNGKPEVTCIRTSLAGSVVTSTSRSTGACANPNRARSPDTSQSAVQKPR